MASVNNLSSALKHFQGEPVAILCARYWYRGIVSEVGEDFIQLANPRAVEVTGIATASAPTTEDVIPSDLIISLAAVEIVCQPAWVFHDLERKDQQAGA